MRVRVSPVLASCLAVTALAGTAGVTRADFILSVYGSGTPSDSWAYSKAVGVGQWNSNQYVPLLPDWAGATFQGFVHQGSFGDWNTVGSGEYDPDTIYVFKTYVESQTDITIPIFFTGDDGHSLYINDALVNSGPFGTSDSFELSLRAGVATKIEIGDYNGPGPMGVQFNQQGTRLPVDSIPGVTFNAQGDFPAAPAPPSLVLLATGAIPLLGWSWLNRRRTRIGPCRKAGEET